MLKVGDKVPSIKLEGENGPTSLKDLEGKIVVLYFYPKDNTPGCTMEACGFRDYNDKIKELGAEIIGVSKDSLKSHAGFKTKQKLNFTLWSDPDHKLMEAFGTWKKKKFMGKEYMGTERMSFVIGKTGKILKIYEKVDPVEHAREVYEYIKTI